MGFDVFEKLLFSQPHHNTSNRGNYVLHFLLVKRILL